MTTLALAILSVGTLACIVYQNIRLLQSDKIAKINVKGTFLYYAPAVYGIACLISAFV
jgi:hypothetical protein